jgi:hypothetical protein
MKKLLFGICAVMLSCSPQETGNEQEPPVETPTEMEQRVYQSGDVFLRWKNNTLSTGYEVKIAPADDPSKELLREASTYYVTIPKKDLEYATTYLWAVRTVIGERKSEWSANGAFTTLAKPGAEEFLGSWQIAPENIETTATIAGTSVNLAELMPDLSGSEPLTFTITEFTEEDGTVADNKVYVEMGDLSSLLPIPTGDFEKVTLAVNADKTLNGSSGQMETVTQDFDPPIQLSEFQGLTDYLSGLSDLPFTPNLEGLSISSVSILVNSVYITAEFPNPEDTSVLQFEMHVTATLSLTSPDGRLEQIFTLLPASMTQMTITTVINSNR